MNFEQKNQISDFTFFQNPTKNQNQLGDFEVTLKKATVGNLIVALALVVFSSKFDPRPEKKYEMKKIKNRVSGHYFHKKI